MRTRTLLTTPPSQAPTEDRRAVEDRPERYSRGLTLPEEPRVPGRLRSLVLGLLVVAVLGAIAWVALSVLLEGQFQDPALTDAPPADAVEPTPAVPAPAASPSAGG